MIRPLMKSTDFLQKESEPATKKDRQVGQDLLDTLKAHADECVGMAANMIGVRKRVIAFEDDGAFEVMFNPSIVECSGEFFAQEGCLCLQGERPTMRYRRICVRFQDESFEWHERSYGGWVAQIIQHEIDHCNGIVV